MNIPLLQTPAWQKLQQDLGKTCFYEQNADFAYLATLETTPLGNYLYLPYGPVAKDLKSFKLALQNLSELAKSQKCVFIRIEPQDTKFLKHLCSTSDFKKTQDLNPKETWVLDLDQDEAVLKAKLPSRLLRYYKAREKNDLEITTSHDPKDIKYLVNLQKNLAKNKKINVFSENYLKTELSQDFATLYLVRHSGKVVAAGLVFDDNATRYNLQGAQSVEGAKLHATGILTIQLILDAASKGLKTFDFWGIAPEGAPKSHPWAGFTNFKKTFAGREVDYCGTWDIILNRSKYTTYSLLRKFNRLVRKIK